MEDRNILAGHIVALFTILVWGITYVSTKILLQSFTPVEILFLRFLLGFCALFCVCPRRIKGLSLRQEGCFALAGFCGVTLYFLFENVALTYTYASNVGVILSAAPFFTALFAGWLLKNERMGRNFYIGFVLAMLGICLISFSGAKSLHLNPLGDLLAVIAAAIWAAYSVLTRWIARFGCSSVMATRHIFFYGLLFMLPVLAFSDFQVSWQELSSPVNIGNLLFLGLGASALCFVTWTYSLRVLGAVKTSVYIYMIPVVTVACAAIVLGERITWMSAGGIALTLLGLLVSQGMPFLKKTS